MPSYYILPTHPLEIEADSPEEAVAQGLRRGSIRTPDRGMEARYLVTEKIPFDYITVIPAPPIVGRLGGPTPWS